MSSRRTVLLTAFEPFEGRTKNASSEALKQIMDCQAECPDLRLHMQSLPVATRVAAQQLQAALLDLRPDVLIALGEAKRDAICLEQIAVNERHFRIPDNTGQQLTGQPVIAGGPHHLGVTLPLPPLLTAIQATGVPARLSTDAGRFLCNEVLYSALHTANQHGLPTRIGFIHVPHLPGATVDDPAAPSLATDAVTEALLAVLRALLPPGDE